MDWLVFYHDEEAHHLLIDINMARLIELQPDTMEGTDEFCREIYPILDKIEEVCLANNLKQVCSVDLEGIYVQNINPITMVRIIWNIHEYKKNCILLEKCQVSGGGSIVAAIINAVRGFLPPFMRPMIELTE